MRCPKCAEIINDSAKMCRFCRHELTRDELAIADRRRKNRLQGWYIAGGLVVALIVAAKLNPTERSSDPSAFDPSSTAQSSSLLSAPVQKTVRLDRFTWENRGGTYCQASASITNTSTETIKFLKINMQFLKNGSLVGSEDAYVDVEQLPPGARSTWDNSYRCPGAGTTVELTANARGEDVRVINP